MKEAILPGALVRCINDQGVRPLIQNNHLYTVHGSALQGSFIYLSGAFGLYCTDRFELIYNRPEDFNSDWACENKEEV